MKNKKLIFTFNLISILSIIYPVSSFAEDLEIILNKMSLTYSKLNSYSCILNKKELIGEKIREQRNIIFKYKKPLSFYMKWTEGSEKGTEAIYVYGKYKNKLVVHIGGYLKFINVSVDPKGRLAMRNNRHSILESHMGHIIQLMQKNYKTALINNELKISFEGNELFDEKNTLLYKAIFPENKNYYGHIILINIDEELSLPVRIRVYGWKKELMEWYEYTKLKVDTGLSEIDFDIENPAYGF